MYTISDSAVNYDLPVCLCVCLFAYCALVCNKNYIWQLQLHQIRLQP